MPNTTVLPALAWYRGSVAECVGDVFEVHCDPNMPGRYLLTWDGKTRLRHVRPESLELASGKLPQPAVTTRVPAYEPASPADGTHYFHARRNEVLPRERYADEDGQPCVLWLTQTFVDV